MTVGGSAWTELGTAAIAYAKTFGENPDELTRFRAALALATSARRWATLDLQMRRRNDAIHGVVPTARASTLPEIPGQCVECGDPMRSPCLYAGERWICLQCAASELARQARRRAPTADVVPSWRSCPACQRREAAGEDPPRCDAHRDHG